METSKVRTHRAMQMARRQQASSLLLWYMYRTGQTVGLAGGAGHAPHLGLVGVFLYACHSGVGVISGRD